MQDDVDNPDLDVQGSFLLPWNISDNRFSTCKPLNDPELVFLALQHFNMDEKDETAVLLTPAHNVPLGDKSNHINEEPPTPEGPTDSHVLAQVEQDEKGLSQLAGDTAEVTDIGWTTPADQFEKPIIAGISNEDLWMLIRRFDKAS